ncbi:hypothetical protein Csa_023660 [Cucumis sativus]|nr:hypothetical protein Csa_023660 [Cucumis sativus]
MKMGRRGMGHQVILIGKMLKCLSCFRQRWAYEQSCSTFKLESGVESFPAELLCFALFLKLKIEIERDVSELGPAIIHPYPFLYRKKERSQAAIPSSYSKQLFQE